ncbi:hypothetical protein ACIBH1_36915 [Nonomuraea sp. NPDC050663]|uniref:hypothetical protein n=1 Tax=Nonomuraea sp. NPDC050663 TaxID=3364370 RepID=UPI00378BDC88
MPQTVVGLARDVVSQLAPDELPDFDLIATAYLVNPKINLRTDEPNGSGWSAAMPFLTSLAMAVIVDLCKDMSKAGGRSLWGWVKERAGWGASADEELPACDDEQRLRELAHGSAVKHGATPQDAARIADAVVNGWHRPQ